MLMMLKRDHASSLAVSGDKRLTETSDYLATSASRDLVTVSSTARKVN